MFPTAVYCSKQSLLTYLVRLFSLLWPVPVVSCPSLLVLLLLLFLFSAFLRPWCSSCFCYFSTAYTADGGVFGTLVFFLSQRRRRRTSPSGTRWRAFAKPTWGTLRSPITPSSRPPSPSSSETPTPRSNHKCNKVYTPVFATRSDYRTYGCTRPR